jgi:hypothetical protein
MSNGNGHGGARPGAGRKPTTRFADEFARAESRLYGGLESLVERILELANGVQTVNNEGVVYTTIPDRQALIYLIDRCMGKPRQAVDHGAASGEETPHKIYLNFDPDEAV